MRAALIGAGQIARQHLSCLKGLPGVEVAAVCDLSPSVAECAAERHGIARWFTDYRSMLRTHVADLFALSAEDPRARGQTFNVVDGQGDRIWSYLGDYLRESGQGGIRIPVPYRLAYSLVSLAYSTLFHRNPRLPHVLVPCRFESRLKPLRYAKPARARGPRLAAAAGLP